MKKIAIFASGNGTNAENIARHFAATDYARVTLVLTNVRNAGVVGRMRSMGIDTYYVPNSEWKANPGNIATFMDTEGIDLVVLAGFMRKVDDELVERFRGRMLNIHPSLLPAYGGKGMYGHHVHEAVIAAGEKESGVTVHQVSEVMDGGDIVAQEKVAIEEGETPESLEAKIHKIEYALYPAAIEKVLGYGQPTPHSEEKEEREKSAPEEKREQSAPEEKREQSAPAAIGEGSEDSVAGQWASALGVPYDEQEAERRRLSMPTPPPMPDAEQPPVYHPAPEQQPPVCVSPADAPVMPSTYLLWSVLCIVFCCTIPGIVATVFSCQVSSRFYNGDYEGAEKASRRAQLWIIIAFCLGVLQATVFTPLYMLSM